MPSSITGSAQTAQHLVRYQALFKLFDDIYGVEQLETILKRVATQWKYIANVSDWHLVIVHEQRYLVLDGQRGEAEHHWQDALSDWDSVQWRIQYPHIVPISQAAADASIPKQLLNQGNTEVIVFPLERSGHSIGLLSAAARYEAFTELDKKFIHLVGARLTERIADILLRKQFIQALTERATHDALTGLFNRGAIMEQLKTQVALAQRGKQTVSILLVDIDHFKSINDQHGHLAGDNILREVSRRMQQNTRQGEHVGRYGGEEFLFVLSPSSTEEALHAAERIRIAVCSSPFQLHETSQEVVDISVSVGVATWSSALMTPASTPALTPFLEQADQALYHAKIQGRNRVCAAPVAS